MRRMILALTFSIAGTASLAAAQTFDHAYVAYGHLLARHVRDSRVNYSGLRADRSALDAVVASFAGVTPERERGWNRSERLAFWINAYNVFTLEAIAARYPIKGRLFSLHPRNSIRQIDGVWTTLTWRAAGRQLTLDGIEHGIIRKEFREPLIHFAVNCASVSCPPLRTEPYVASKLMAQLEDSARRYLASREGSRVEARTLQVSSIFDWYGEDFLATAAGLRPARRSEIELAVRAFLEKYGPPDVARLASDPAARLNYLSYDWSLNDVSPRESGN